MQIPSEDDPQQLPDPFSDLSVGGWEVTDEPVGRLSVWAVTLQGKVRPPQSCGWEVADRPPTERVGERLPPPASREDEGGRSLGPLHVLSQQWGLPEQVACRWGPHSPPSCDPAVLGTPWVLVLLEASELPACLVLACPSSEHLEPWLAPTLGWVASGLAPQSKARLPSQCPVVPPTQQCPVY